MQDSLPAGWLAFAGRELNPLDCDERFPSCYILFPLSWIYPDATKVDPQTGLSSLPLFAKKPSDDAQELERAVGLGHMVVAAGRAGFLLIPLHRV